MGATSPQGFCTEVLRLRRDSLRRLSYLSRQDSVPRIKEADAQEAQGDGTVRIEKLDSPLADEQRAPIKVLGTV